MAEDTARMTASASNRGVSTPTPPRLTGDPAKDVFLQQIYLGDLQRALIQDAQLTRRAARLAAVDIAKITNPAAATAKIVELTPIALPAFSSPSTDVEMAAL